MRLNQYIASCTGVSRRAADILINGNKVLVNNAPATLGLTVTSQDKVIVNGLQVKPKTKFTTILLNKPVDYVCSRNGQGNKTVYDLLPKDLHNLKPVGRLDKDSSGLLLLTNDGKLANQLTHPRYQKEKVYEVELDKPLTSHDKNKIEQGVMLNDGISKLKIAYSGQRTAYRVEQSQPKPERSTLYAVRLRVALAEGRNRQIRRTFAALGYKVVKLHRTQFGNYELGNLKPGNFKKI